MRKIKSTTQAILILSFFILLSLPVSAYNITSSPIAIDVSLNKNETKNITFKITNYEAKTFNLTFKTINKYIVNFTPNYHQLSIGSVEVNATMIPFDQDGEYNDTIQVVNIENLTTEGLFDIPIRFFVGKAIRMEFYFKKCFIDNATEYCSNVNISDYQNVTVINETTIEQDISLVVPWSVFQDYMEKSKKEQTEIKDSIVNASQTLAGGRSEQEMIYYNSQILKGILRNSLDSWLEIKPDNVLKNITGLSDGEFANAVQYLDESGEITTRVIKEDLPYVIVAPPDFQPKRSIMHTQIGLMERVNADTTFMYAEVIVGVIIIVVAILLVAQRVWTKYKGTPKWKI